MNYHVRYELARIGTGIEDRKYDEYHFPNDEELKDVKNNVLKDGHTDNKKRKEKKLNALIYGDSKR